MRRRSASPVLVFAGLLAAGVVGAAVHGADGAAQGGPTEVDARTGVVAGVRIGDTAGQIETKLGRATFGNEFSPRRTRPFTGPLAIPAPDSIQAAVAQYQSHAFLIGSIGTYSLKTVAPGAATQRGVGVGEPLSAVRQAYPGTRCGRYLQGEGTAFDWCSARIGLNAVFFGGDPIASITVTRVGRPARPQTSRIVDVRRGSYRGVSLGFTRQQVVARLGPAPKWKAGRDPALPLVRSLRGVTPGLGKPIRPLEVLRYPDVAYVLGGGRVYAFVVGGNAGGRRPNGVALMGRMSQALSLHRGLRCRVELPGQGRGSLPICSGRVGRNRWLWVAGDPVANVVVATAPLPRRA
jgi:hypothetical protein